MRLLGIDFGEKRVGLAISDDGERVATPLATIARSSDSQVVAEILSIVAQEQIGGIIIGEPRRHDGSRGDAARRVHSFSHKLHRASGLTIQLSDELLTTREAANRLRGGRHQRTRRDALAAQILLQQVLDEPSARLPLPERPSTRAGR